MKKIIILTGSELRHSFFRMKLALDPDIQVLRSYCETSDFWSSRIINESTGSESDHLQLRNATERDFFDLFCQYAPDHSNPVVIQKGEINHEKQVKAIIEAEPDLLVAYGCSIIRSSLLKNFQARFINIHLGLSPYYRGSGTNFWPFVNGEPEFAGITFMHIDEGIDTGKIIHQIRPDIYTLDNIHSIGNRLIVKMAKEATALISVWDQLGNPNVSFNHKNISGKYYRKNDFSSEAVEIMVQNFQNGIVEEYLKNKISRDGKVPIFNNPELIKKATS